ncbi:MULTISPECIES: glycosyltransferase family A protein [Bacillus]|uniref:glycosyltransferase family A protein n=1 Tax=Bacillus TaxID=1386 RepID=UPI000D012CAA|nr:MULTISPECIES: glycosyltransferase family A protein [Bacillus]MDR0124906.1 glycosyltransferase family A protein [Bacillus zhangzhouensis]PRO42506.1 spore maturation protein [Bacillus sp. LLTC93]
MIMKVSVILTSYNKPDFIDRVLKSMVEQTYQNWELLIMDDGSEPETTKKIQPFLDDKRIHLYPHTVHPAKRLETVRYATLINEALTRITGELICYLTDDTMYRKDRLQKMVDVFQSKPHIDIVYSSQRVVHVDKHLVETMSFVREADQMLEHASFQVDHCSVMHRRRLLPLIYEKYGQYWDDDPKHWHHADSVFWMRLNYFAAFFPLKDVLDTTYKTPQSFHHMFSSMPYDLIDGTVIEREGAYCQIAHGNLHGIDRCWVNEKKRRAIRIPLLCAMKYEMNEMLAVPNYTVVSADNGRTFYYIEDQKKRRFASKRDMQYFQFHPKEIYTISNDLLQTFDDGEIIQAFPVFSPPNRRLFKWEQDVYLLMHDTFCRIVPEVMKLFAFNHQPIRLFPSQFTLFQEGKPIVPLYMESLHEFDMSLYQTSGRKHSS